jgi:hypothetical protein
MASAGTANARTKWLCKPGKKPNPCLATGGRLRTTVISSDGRARVVNPRPGRNPKIDCFYVYPTVSTQTGPNANLRIDPEETGIARDQASRFSRTCRVYAPMYRQITTPPQGFGELKQAAKVAYADVRDAWRVYLKRFNKGRGVVLIGHSQGAVALTKLMRNEIDRRPRVRRRLVSAILTGGNVLVKKGKAVGGDFRNVRACRSPAQTGCVLAYSTFAEPPEADSLYGRPPRRGSFADAFGLPLGAPNLHVLCTNPASLSGGAGALRTILPSVAPTGLFDELWGEIFNGDRPTASTPWITPQDHYSGRCVTSNGANVLMLSPIDGAQQLTQPLPGYGLHDLDVEIALGNLTATVQREARAYLRRNSR